MYWHPKSCGEERNLRHLFLLLHCRLLPAGICCFFLCLLGLAPSLPPGSIRFFMASKCQAPNGHRDGGRLKAAAYLYPSTAARGCTLLKSAAALLMSSLSLDFPASFFCTENSPVIQAKVPSVSEPAMKCGGTRRHMQPYRFSHRCPTAYSPCTHLR